MSPLNTILIGSDQMPFYTDLRLVFDGFGGRQKEFTWLITDLECFNLGDHSGKLEMDMPMSPILVSGERLTEVVYENKIQFIWGVFSGFHPSIEIDVNNLTVEPFANGNPGFWRNPPQIQHPEATVELVCWDSTSTLLLSEDDDLDIRFRSYFSDARDLESYNQEP